MGPGKKPRARHKFFVSGSSVFWSRLSSSPHRRTPSLCQGQQREGERETGECKGGRVGGAIVKLVVGVLVIALFENSMARLRLDITPRIT